MNKKINKKVQNKIEEKRREEKLKETIYLFIATVFINSLTILERQTHALFKDAAIYLFRVGISHTVKTNKKNKVPHRNSTIRNH